MPKEHSLPSPVLRRRELLQGLMLAGLVPALTSRAWAADSVLPLDTPGLDHLDIIVPDVAASARFYMGLFNTALHAQPFQGAQRYFILLGELNERREAGYIAIGESRGRGTYIGHFCTSVREWRRDSQAIFTAMGEAIEAAGFGAFPGSTGVGGIFKDPDGIEIQFLPSPDTVVTAAVPSDLVPWHQGLVTPRGVDHMLLHVSDLERAVQYYNILYGAETRIDGSGRAMFEFPESDTRLLLQQIDYGYATATGIARYGIKVDPFDRDTVVTGLQALGATVLDVPEEPEVLRLVDPDGITLELRPV